MDNSQTPVKQGPCEEEPVADGDRSDSSTGGYYYDDTTGYETYREDDEEESDEKESRGPAS